MREPGSPGKGRPICHVSISSWGPERSRRSWQYLRRDAAQLIGTIERNALARYLFHWRPRGMGFHSHLRAAVAGHDLRDIQTRWRHELRGLHRLTRRPNEEGKSSKDNEPAPEDQDQHARTIRRTLPPFKTASASATGFLLNAASTGVATQSVSVCVSAIIMATRTMSGLGRVSRARRRGYWRRSTVREMKEGPSSSAIRC